MQKPGFNCTCHPKTYHAEVKSFQQNDKKGFYDKMNWLIRLITYKIDEKCPMTTIKLQGSRDVGLSLYYSSVTSSKNMVVKYDEAQYFTMQKDDWIVTSALVSPHSTYCELNIFTLNKS